ncbi:MAG: ATP-binding protein [Bacteroidia bacterium]|nr:ATP-binding protein [Bacteroidia bacterium]
MPEISFPKRLSYIRKVMLAGFLGMGITSLGNNYFNLDAIDPISIRLIPMGFFLLFFLITYQFKLNSRQLENGVVGTYIVLIGWLAGVLYLNRLRPDYATTAYIVILMLPLGLVSIRDLWNFMIPSVLIVLAAVMGIKDPLSNKFTFASLFITASFAIFYLQLHLLKNKSRIQATEKRLMDVIHASRECIWEIDKNHRFVFVSDRATEIMGYSPEELLQMTPYDFVREGERPMIKQWFDYLSNRLKEMYNVEYQAIRKDGKKIWLEITGIPFFDEEGEYKGYRGTLLDISGRKQQQKNLIEAKERAEEAVKARSQFLSVMSHEIRTPMNAVIGTTHLLMQENPRPDQIDNLETLQFSAENLLVIINDILDYSKIEAGKIEFEETEFNLKTLAQRIFKSLGQKASEKNLQFILDNDPALPENVLGDPTRLSQILTNLLNNAIKFTEKGSVSLQTKVKWVVEDEAEITFLVSDTGIGIPSDKIEHIFDSFTQASSDTTRKYGGTGLGLAICKRLVELQGSEIRVESEVGKGSVFFFTLTMKSGSKKSADPSSGVEKEDFQNLGGVKVLLVEDNRINQKIATKFLEKWGVDVAIADNGKIALDMISQSAYALILMDLQMPEMDGYEATRKIREMDGNLAHIPIIALTASAMNEVQGNVEQAGMNGYASKPFNPRELYRKIVALLPVADQT